MASFQFLTLLIISVYCASVYSGLQEVYRWRQLTYNDLPETAKTGLVFPEDDLLRDSSSTLVIPENNLLMGVNHYKERLFLTVPRRRWGIPATLNYIDLSKITMSDRSPSLRPYPNLETNQVQSNLMSNPETIVSVYRTDIDACDRMWFIDTGLLEIPDNRTQVQRPSIWIMNLETNQRIRRFEIPESVSEFGNGYASITVDVEAGRCDDAFAYIPDLALFQLSVYSYRENRLWTFQHNYFSFDPLRGNFDVGGHQFQWNDGIFSVTLGNKDPNGYRPAYFLSMASTSQFVVSTQVLQNESLADRGYHGEDFKYLGDRGEGRQTTMARFDPTTGVMFYAEVGRNAVGCWNLNSNLLPQNLDTVSQSAETMIYPSDLVIDAESNLWVVTNTLPRFVYHELNPGEFNFRVWRANTQDAIRGLKCAK